LQKLFADAPDDVLFLLVDDQGRVYQTSGDAFSFSNRDLLTSLIFDPDRKSSFSYEKTTNNSDFWVFAYPCDSHAVDGHNIKGFMVSYPAEKFASSFTLSLFNEKGYALMVGEDGTIQLKPTLPSWIGYNLFTSLKNNGFPAEGLASLQNVFTDKNPGNVAFDLGSAKYLLHYESVANVDLGLASAIVIIVPVGVITHQVSASMNLLVAATILVAVALLIILVQVIFLLKKNADERRGAEERSRMEIALKTAEVKNEFLARMSHDIRTPLNAIIGLSYIQAENLDKPEIVEDCNNKMTVSAEYLLQILNDVLDLSKISSGKLEIAQTPFALEALLDSVETMVKTRCDEKKLRFVVDAPEHFDHDFIGDRLRISQILMNLLTNAVKFTPAGGLITLSAQENMSLEGASQVVFHVKDTGIGMSPEFMKRIFQPFEQSDVFTTEKFGGSGLGLSIVKNLTDLMGGTVLVATEEGKGSDFAVILPLKTAPKSAEESAKDEVDPAVFKGKTVLLAEDNEINQMIAQKIISSFGITVEVADNGKIALEKYLAKPAHAYDAVLTDIRMPIMDGYQLAEAIRSAKTEDAKSIPIVALSANAFAEDVRASLSHGMNAHLRKPINVNELRATLFGLFKGGKA
jgi:signal transduction histidine kinase/CheY-like chemotaxis protein